MVGQLKTREWVLLVMIIVVIIMAHLITMPEGIMIIMAMKIMVVEELLLEELQLKRTNWNNI